MIQTLSDALAERGYETLTPVQQAVTDPALNHADLLVSAQTGSGKTVGFGLALGPTLLDDSGVFGPASVPMALIVAPTRELAFQVTRELAWLYARAGARVVSCVGGMAMRDERRALERGAHIVVGTPGRLRDHIQRGSLDMSGLRAIVLDEADEMLDLGFREDLEFMLGEAPAERRTLLFSATVPASIVKLAQNYQRDAVRVTTLTDKGQHADISYQALRVAARDAENAIINVLRYHDAQNALVFANTRATVSRLTARFANRGFAVVSLSGELSQAERTHALQAMRDGRARVCVATDVAARGIDLPNLELVIHAELPSNAEALLHRSGRTGRAGRKGISALVVPPKLTAKAERLLRTARVQAEWTTAPGADEILERDETRLLEDPAWGEEISEAEAAFGAKLLARQSPEAVAAAYLRLYRTKHSAPEELSPPDARPEPKDRKPFGPSSWIALSVGRDDRAEPRWLLPLVLRTTGLDKDAVGAIRVQQSETFVELTDASMPKFLGALGEGGLLEEGVTARAIEGTPSFGRPTGPRPDAPERGPKRGPASRRDDPRPETRPEPRDEPRPGPADSAQPKPKPGPKPGPKPRPQRDEAVHVEVKPRAAALAKPTKPAATGKPAGKPMGKPSGKPAGKPFAKPGKPFAGKSGGKPGGKPFAKGGAKPAPAAGKPAAAAPAANRATDTSKRFTPPAGGGTKRGGSQPPRRKG